MWNRLFPQTIAVLGDSHAAIFANQLIAKALPGYKFSVMSVSGATLSGLANPNSKTQARVSFDEHLGRIKSAITIVQIGEVDTGFVIWYRAEKHQISVADMLQRAVDNYQALLLSLKESTKVVCMSAPLPTLKDGDYVGNVANARRSVKASQVARTNLTLQFNGMMKQFCRANNIEFWDMDEQSLGANGLVADRLLNLDKSDHHYAADKY